MAITHNYLETADFKPTAAETAKAELVVNLADGTLWSENGSGTVIKIGGGTYTQGTGITITGDSIAATTHAGGDVTGDVNLTIGNGKVTLAKMANIATDTFIGRTTAGSGVPEALSAAAALAILPAITATTGGVFSDANAVKFNGIEAGAEANNISDVNATDLTDGGDTTLHGHTLAKISDAGTAAALNVGIDASDIPQLDGSGKLNTSVLPGLALTDVYSEISEVAQLALTVQEGDVCIRTDESKTYIALNSDNVDMGDWALLQTPTGTATSLGYTAASTQGTITNNTGANAVIPSVTPTGGTNLAGLMIPADKTKINFISVTQAVNLDTMESNIATNNAKNTNVSTQLSNGTISATTYGITSDGGSNDVILTSATGTLSGVMPAADKVKTNHITVTQAVNLDTMESNQIGSLLTGESV